MKKSRLIFVMFALALQLTQVASGDWLEDPWKKPWYDTANIWGCAFAGSSCRGMYSSTTLNVIVKDEAGPAKGAASFSGVATTKSGTSPMSSGTVALNTKGETRVKLNFARSYKTQEIVSVGDYRMQLEGKSVKARASRLRFLPGGEAVIDAYFYVKKDELSKIEGNEEPKALAIKEAQKPSIKKEGSAIGI